MQEEAKTKLVTAEEAATMLDLKRDYVYGRGVAVDREETHLRDYWRIIRRRLWVPISALILVVTLATIYNLRLPSIYEGVTEVELVREDRVVNLKDLQINMGGSDDSQYINTQLKIMQSPPVAYLVTRALDLEHNPDFLPGLSRPLNQQTADLEVSSGESDTQAEMQRLEPYINTLLGNVEIKPIRETRLIEIHYRHQNKELARKIADTWADAYIKNIYESRAEANKKASQFLDKSIAGYKLKLREAEERLLNYRRSNQVLDFGEKENTVSERLAALNQLLLQAETDRKNAQLAYEMSRGVADISTVPEIQRDPIAQELNKKITDLRQQREQLLVEFTPEWPAVKKVTQQLEQLEGELRASHQRILTTIENQYRAATQKEDGLRKAFAQQRAETMQQNEGAISAKMLQQEVDTNREMLANLLKSQQGVEVSTAGLLKDAIRVTKHAALPQVPVAPKRTQNILLSALLALIAGVGLVLFLDYINNKIESVEDIDRYMKLPALGVIPMLPNTGKARRLLTGGGNGADNGKELAPALANNGQVILTQVEANSSMAESYRQLRTALLLSSAGHAPRTLLITSSQPAEGKTTTSVNTAISLAQTGAAVLIVDADLRRPRVHKMFGLKNNVGLSNFLAGEGELASLIQIAMPNLYVLPVGPLPPNPAELLGSARMKTVVETLSSNFDYVVIDSPPVSSFADSLILSALVEGVIIVVKGGVTPREMAQRTKAHLQSVGAKILGVVINQIKLQPHDYYYYSTYYSRYYYGNGDKDGDKDSEATSKPRRAED
ncbi:MAG: polysaccharide biosynthesis tyrosine autokinase [Acidobacteria bacterium]|nr:polysaccharide biosynthesis tyrosine autokinase [Acidobacteriota bacterium]